MISSAAAAKLRVGVIVSFFERSVDSRLGPFREPWRQQMGPLVPVPSPTGTADAGSITAKIGEGGMGQVYQARDTKLDRQVALKILPEAFAAGSERLAQFQREAQVLASLNHPGIGHIYGLEEVEGQKALVLELVEGATLVDRSVCDPR